MLMPFGKHRDKPIHQISKRYLKWCLSNLDELSPDLRSAIAKGINGIEWNPKEPTAAQSIDDVLGEWE